MLVPSRRGFIAGLTATLFAAPAVVRAASLMQIRGEPLMTVHMRVIKATDSDIARLDVLYGSFTTRPEWEALVGPEADWLKTTQTEFDRFMEQYPHDVRHAKQIALQRPNQQLTMKLMTFPENLGSSPDNNPYRHSDRAWIEQHESYGAGALHREMERARTRREIEIDIMDLFCGEMREHRPSA